MAYRTPHQDQYGRGGEPGVEPPEPQGGLPPSPKGRRPHRPPTPTPKLLLHVSLTATTALFTWAATTSTALAGTSGQLPIADLTARLERVESDLARTRARADGLAAGVRATDRRLAGVERELRAALAAGERQAPAKRLALARRAAALDLARAGRAKAKRALDAKVERLAKSKARLQGQVRALLERRRATAKRRVPARPGRHPRPVRLASVTEPAEPSSPRRRRCDLSGLSRNERRIVMRESGGNPYASNRRSSAFGLGQLTRPNRIRYLGDDHDSTDCDKQLRAFRAYVADTYGSATAAWAFMRAKGWY